MKNDFGLFSVAGSEGPKKNQKRVKNHQIRICGFLCVAKQAEKYLNAKEELWKLKYFTMQK